MLDIPSLLDSA